jgi:hypothetical protein
MEALGRCRQIDRGVLNSLLERAPQSSDGSAQVVEIVRQLAEVHYRVLCLSRPIMSVSIQS